LLHTVGWVVASATGRHAGDRNQRVVQCDQKAVKRCQVAMVGFQSWVPRGANAIDVSQSLQILAIK